MSLQFNETELLERVDNDWEFLGETVQMLASDGPGLLREIQQAAAQRDAAALGRSAHALKGMISNFSAADAQASAMALEKLGRGGDLTGVDPAVRDLETKLAALIEELTQFVAARPEMRILIAEDERISRMALARQLQSWGHELTVTEDGQQAWEQVQASPPFDLVLTDWEMPRMSGVELVRRIRQAAPAAYTYIIILTSRSEKDDVVAGIEAGADDYLSKPFDRNELRVRLLSGERVVRLERTLSLQNSELREANDRIRTGLQAAAKIQQSMLPRRNIVTPHARTAWKYIPTEEVAGDAVGLYLIDDRYLIAYVLDVSGHGVPAALLSVSAMRLLEPEPAGISLLRNLSSASGNWGTVQRPAQVLADLNQSFRAGENDNRFLTVVLCVLDTHDGRLFFSSAGHPFPLIFRDGRALELPDTGGVPVAVMDDAEYEDCIVQLEPGDRVCLFSDGLVEQSAGGREQFGMKRIEQELHSRIESPPEEAVKQVLSAFATWAGTNSFTDDVSLVIVDWKPDA